MAAYAIPATLPPFPPAAPGCSSGSTVITVHSAYHPCDAAAPSAAECQQYSVANGLSYSETHGVTHPIGCIIHDYWLHHDSTYPRSVVYRPPDGIDWPSDAWMHRVCKTWNLCPPWPPALPIKARLPPPVPAPPPPPPPPPPPYMLTSTTASTTASTSSLLAATLALPALPPLHPPPAQLLSPSPSLPPIRSYVSAPRLLTYVGAVLVALLLCAIGSYRAAAGKLTTRRALKEMVELMVELPQEETERLRGGGTPDEEDVQPDTLRGAAPGVASAPNRALNIEDSTEASRGAALAVERGAPEARGHVAPHLQTFADLG